MSKTEKSGIVITRERGFWADHYAPIYGTA